MSTAALVLWFGFGEHTATWAVLGLIIVAAALGVPRWLLPRLQVFAVAHESGRNS